MLGVNSIILGLTAETASLSTVVRVCGICRVTASEYLAISLDCEQGLDIRWLV